MGLLSTLTSVTRYKVDGRLEEPIVQSIAQGLKKYAIADIDGNPTEQAIGWTSFQAPFQTNFDSSNFVIGSDIVFSLRVDKKSIPSQMLQKHVAGESAKRLKELKRDFLSQDEKKAIKDHVFNRLSLTMPATPNIYEIVWQYEKGQLWFFSNLKGANEALETMFAKSFQLHLIRLIPYTMAAFDKTISKRQQDALTQLSYGEKND